MSVSNLDVHHPSLESKPARPMEGGFWTARWTELSRVARSKTVMTTRSGRVECDEPEEGRSIGGGMVIVGEDREPRNYIVRRPVGK